MAILFMFLFLIAGACVIINLPAKRFYQNGKKIATIKEIDTMSKLYKRGYAIIAAIFTWLTLMSNYLLQLDLYRLYGSKIAFALTILYAIGSYIVYRKLSDILLEHGYIKAIEKNYRPQDRLFQLREDVRCLNLEMNPKFSNSIDEVVRLFWESNHSLPLDNQEPSICQK